MSVAAAVSLGGSIFCGMLCAGIGPGFVMVVIVVGIINVDMVSIFVSFRFSSPWRTVFSAIRHVSRQGLLVRACTVRIFRDVTPIVFTVFDPRCEDRLDKRGWSRDWKRARVAWRVDRWNANDRRYPLDQSVTLMPRERGITRSVIF